MKYLLWLIIGILVWAYFRAARQRASAQAEASTPTAKEAGKMLACAHCGVYHPADETFSKDGKAYCCAQHRDHHA